MGVYVYVITRRNLFEPAGTLRKVGGRWVVGEATCRYCGADLSPRGACNDDCDSSRVDALEADCR